MHPAQTAHYINCLHTAGKHASMQLTRSRLALSHVLFIDGKSVARCFCEGDQTQRMGGGIRGQSEPDKKGGDHLSEASCCVTHLTGVQLVVLSNSGKNLTVDVDEQILCI